MVGGNEGEKRRMNGSKKAGWESCRRKEKYRLGKRENQTSYRKDTGSTKREYRRKRKEGERGN